MNERQIVAVLTLAGSVVALGFSVYNLYIALKYPNGVATKVAKSY